MGDYATVAQLSARFEDVSALAHLTYNEEAGVSDDDVLTSFIDESEGFINSYLAARYAIPVNVATDTRLANFLRGLTLDLAEFNLLSGSDQVSEAKTKKYDRVIEWLIKFAEGKVQLPADSPPATTVSRGARMAWGSGDAEVDVEGATTRQFTRGQLGNL